MIPLLEQLYYGDIAPGLEEPTPTYKEISKRVSESEHKIIKVLGKKNKKLFIDYQSIEDELMITEQNKKRPHALPHGECEGRSPLLGWERS